MPNIISLVLNNSESIDANLKGNKSSDKERLTPN